MIQGRTFVATPASAATASSSRRSMLVRASTALPAEVRTVTPLGNRVLVKSVEPEQKTTSGILLPTSSSTRPNQGEVINNGSATGVSTGDRVVYSTYAGTTIEVNGTPHLILKEDDVIGTLPGSDDISGLKPLQDRILIEVVEASDKTSGGLLLTDAAKEKPTIGKVIAVGPGRVDDDGKSHSMNVSVGAKVLYQKYSGSEFTSPSGTEYIVVRDVDILAVLA